MPTANFFETDFSSFNYFVTTWNKDDGVYDDNDDDDDDNNNNNNK